ncbi:MAG: septation protein SepH [Dermatophilaceae bacterium]
MQDLQLIGVHEDGEHLLLAGGDGGRFRMRVDEALRAAIRHDRPRLGQLQIEIDGGLRPRDVQALIRAGASSEEAASRAGWTIDKVHRYEGPILAEREHVTSLAREARLRARGSDSSAGNAPTLSARVNERLKGRGVDATESSWDSWRADEGPWTVVLTFAAGGRQRQASWSFDPADRSVSAVDDEARWLSEAEQLAEGPIPAPHLPSPSGRATKLYDVEAEGGLRTPDPVVQHDEPLDLMTAMRERSNARGRRRSGGRRGSPKAPNNVPGAGDHAPDQALPLEDLSYDPESMPHPPAAHADPDPSGADGRPEPAAAAFLIDLGDHDSTFPDPAVRATASDEPAEDEGEIPQARKPSHRKTGRPSVPAWGDIMFGPKPGADRSSS